ncbi:MAG: hypothetical protein NUV63_06325 [Gallionella sp.]|nr:hypothetical protein [Gallionella sp.]
MNNPFAFYKKAVSLDSVAYRNLRYAAKINNQAALSCNLRRAITIPFDINAVFCQTVAMFRPFRKFVAVILAIWFPLFSGSALANSVAMPSGGGACQSVVAQQNTQQPQQVAAMHQHMHHAQPVVNQYQPAGADDHQDSSCKTGSLCHLACSVYLAAAAANVAKDQLAAQLFTLPSTQFQSYVSAPLDPPPLSRV